MISRIIHLVADLVLASLEVDCVLKVKLTYLIYGRATRKSGPALVAMTSWSRMPRFSAHSPMNSSDVSS